ncbi:MAG: 30S ribosomal protein S17 [Phycisphaerae bacterium]|nr:30S ribosomal protein S17 [Phycisphaerae bacterium]HBZ97038.1 30S ribosomal protein S17 [Phycisphaerales bacterium]
MGSVDSASRDKSCKVTINYLVRHPKYGKYVRRRTSLHVHDERNEARVGDRVEIAECRPISKTKSWTLMRVVESKAGADHASEGTQS